ncbi:protein tilB homolog [Dendronephthya gigantea]|uniref:protein tilB homolog n=1 Tax=Dendronephthya gigantea TaxID=151771 RepID=UPI0010690684|nr:protein tilB homolog [Dendronephthya gigantea]
MAIFSAADRRRTATYESGVNNMVRITEDLVRKRAEHNNCELSTLEEVSLHQLDIERIEILDKVCRELKILYLQSNLIPKIENVGRLKKLEYLNLALNNIEKVENLQGCESLQKLDLTVNFVGELTSIESLRVNYRLQELFLTGNPCTQFTSYREYVITTLPHLKTLDGKEIEKSERILAKQDYDNIVRCIVDQENDYKKEIESKRNQQGDEERDHLSKDKSSENEKDTEDDASFWQEEVEYTPESRVEIHKHMEEKRKNKEQIDKSAEKAPKEVRFFAKDGRPLNINQGKLDFNFTDDEENNVFLFDLACPRYLDTSLINVDVQMNYVRVIVKGKIMQLALPEEIKPDSSTAKRSQVTGHLLLTMPKLKGIIRPKQERKAMPKESLNEGKINGKYMTGKQQEKLEVDPSVRKDVDFGNIVCDKSKDLEKKYSSGRKCADEEVEDEEFVDDPDVPPLI